MRARPAAILLALAALACAGPYAERPPGSETTGRPPADAAPAGRPAPAAGDTARTVIGHVTPEGRLEADTLAQAPAAETVDRETVVTGYVRPPGAPGDASRDEPPAAPLNGPLPAESDAPPAAGAGIAAAAPGWRIQVFATRDQAAAREVARRAGEAVAGIPAYVEAEGPWFKVRVGDFATRDAAEPLRERLVELGWTEAWAVRTTVHAP
ncbi:MAG TPA: SPOR domain-containing protein [Gemmatimonadota bacterium]|nr:SPOR domain-containing protein [Gemmatimonadota bacterium]